jgi:hypothetical protein
MVERAGESEQAKKLRDQHPPTYPTAELHLRDEENWASMTAYGLAGTMDVWQDYPEGKNTALFGGYMKVNRDTTEAVGILTDPAGESIIRGNFLEDSFIFYKTYLNPRFTPVGISISYSLRKEGDLWVGTYVMPHYNRVEIIGHTRAQIFPIAENAYYMQRGPATHLGPKIG